MKAEMRQWMLGAGLLLGALGTAPGAQAQQGTISGVVTDEATSDPLEAARGILVGPNRIEGTRVDTRSAMFHRAAIKSGCSGSATGRRPIARPWPLARPSP